MAGDVGPTAAPASAKRIANAFAPVSLGAITREMGAFDSTFVLEPEARSFGGRPLVVLSSDRPMSASERKMMRMTELQDQKRQEGWRALQAELAAWSTNGRHETLTDASHSIQFDRPDAVIRAVREVVAAVRGRALVGFTPQGLGNYRIEVRGAAATGRLLTGRPLPVQ
jgi:hypothetical protein